MLRSKSAKAVFKIIFALSLLALLIISCKGGGDTDGGPGKRQADAGDPFVSDGGAGGSIKITAPEEIDTGDIDGFFVELKDPRGEPLPFIRVFCESEQGIAIIEPSRNGVAFEHTGADGRLSGQLGGLTPGSYLFECRAQQGFNLVDRVTIKIRGDIPAGFAGFPGAAGGNLGGGRIVEEPEQPEQPGDTPAITSVRFIDITSESTEIGFIDLVQNGNCDGDPATVDPEPFGSDTLSITISNPTEEPLNVGNIRFTVNDGSGVSSLTEFSGTQIAAGGSSSVIILLTDFVPGGAKRWAGSGTAVSSATSSITISATGTLDQSGDAVTLGDSVTYTANSIDNCS
jgi:hypothetical protein